MLHRKGLISAILKRIVLIIAGYLEHTDRTLMCFSFVSHYFQGRTFQKIADPIHTSYKTSQWVRCVVGTRANFSTQSLSLNEPVVSVDWLHANLREPDMKVPASSFL